MSVENLFLELTKKLLSKDDPNSQEKLHSEAFISYYSLKIHPFLLKSYVMKSVHLKFLLKQSKPVKINLLTHIDKTKMKIPTQITKVN